MNTLTITKLEAARHQLQTAIRLYFEEGDVVSIHTLVAAAYNIIRDINEHRNGQPMWVKDMVKKVVGAEYEKIVHDELNSFENFFKHADRDPDGTIEFTPEWTELFLMDACDKYYSLTKDNVAEIQLFCSWIAVHQPEYYPTPSTLVTRYPDAVKDAAANGRRAFFAACYPLACQVKA